MSKQQSFPRTVRLTTPGEFKNVFEKSKKYHFKEFTVYCHRKAKLPACLGLAVSKKVDKRAVTRNAIKRLIRESFRQNQSKLLGWDIVVVAKPIIKQRNNAEIFELLESVWKELQCVN